MAVAGDVDGRVGRAPPRPSPLNDPKIRGIIIQIVLGVAFVGVLAWFAVNTYQNLQRANIASGFGFLWQRAGFDISESYIPYSIESTYARAFVVGLLNTIVVAVIGIIFASIIGFIVGISRLSRNWLVRTLATVYVETFRNIPVLLVLLFWYKAVLTVLPGPRQGFELPFGATLSNRGLVLPRGIPQDGFFWTPIALAIAIAAVILLGIMARRRREATGQRIAMFWPSVGILVLLPGLVFLMTGAPLEIQYPELKGFNFVGGVGVTPEFTALLLGLTLYTASFIAEIVRAGILSVPRGQIEAAHALGLTPGTTLRLIVIPQALRVIVPPLTNQYLNLLKNSSLAIAVGYPDLVSVFARTVLNQTGQAIEVIFITMMVYLFLSVVTSLFMNWFNRRVALRGS